MQTVSRLFSLAKSDQKGKFENLMWYLVIIKHDNEVIETRGNLLLVGPLGLRSGLCTPLRPLAQPEAEPLVSSFRLSGFRVSLNNLPKVLSFQIKTILKQSFKPIFF